MKLSFHFPCIKRLGSTNDYRLVFNDAKKVSNRYFTVLYREQNLVGPRMGLAIAKKKINKSSDRNRIKRVIRESFRINYYDLPAVDVIVMPTSNLKSFENPELFDALKKLWVRIK